MIPTINEQPSNDNKTIGKVVHRKIANEQVDPVHSYEKTISRIIKRHNAPENKKLISWENDNSGESFIRPKAPDAAGASNRTLDRIIANHGRDDDSNVSWENDNSRDFFKPVDREGSDEDHNETLNRIMSKQSKQQDAEYVLGPDKTLNSESQLGEKSVVDYLKSIDNTETNILDVIHQMNKLMQDLVEDNSVASQKAREMDHEAGHVSSHPGLDGLSDALRQALKGHEKEDKEDSLKVQMAKIAKGLGVGATATLIGGGIGELGSLLPHNEKAETGGYTGHEQKPENKSSNPNRNTGVVPKEIKASPVPHAERSVVPLPHVRTPGGRKAQIQLALFEAFKKQGYTDEGAKTMVAEVGRENSFREDLIFGSHKDPYNKVTNIGMISWQKDRATKLYNDLQSRGLIDKNGRMIHSQTALEAQAAFLDREMVTNRKMHDARALLKDPRAKYAQIEAEVGRHVISWRHDDPKYSANGHRAQEQALAEINSLLRNPGNRGATLNQQSAQDTAKGNTVIVYQNNQKTVQQAPQQKTATKPHIPPARSNFWDGWAKYFGLGDSGI
jgi:hypothetical protein